MADGGDGFMGRCEVVEPRRRGKRHWPDENGGAKVGHGSGGMILLRAAE